jgi:Flp pilus assembly protein TadD/uncharacterized protein (AIM24 family)
MPDIPRGPFDQGLFLTHFNKGRELYDSHRLDEAERELEEAYLLRPRDQRVLNLLGLVYFKQEKLEKAEEVYRKLVAESPEANTLHYNLGLIYFKLNRLEDAESSFLKALELSKGNPKINFYLGSIYERLRRHKDAIYQYRQAGAHLMVRRVEDKLAAALPAKPSPRRDTDTGEFPKDELQESIRRQADMALARADQALAMEKLVQPVSPALLAEDAVGPVPAAMQTQELRPPIEKARFRVREAPPLPPGPAGPSTSLVPGSPLTPPATAAAVAPVPGALPAAPPGAAARSPGHRSPSATRPPVVTTRPFLMPTSDTGPLLPVRPEGSAPPPPAETFRFLENNLMEVSFTGKVYLKQGTIYSWSGNLTFWVKEKRPGGQSALVIVTGSGKILLTDKDREITLMHVADEPVYVEPGHLLACEEGLSPRYVALGEGTEPNSSLEFLVLEGRGMAALSATGKPLSLSVAPGLPVSVPATSVILWSGAVQPHVVEDPQIYEIMLPAGAPAHSLLRLEGSGRVLVEQSARS